MKIVSIVGARPQFIKSAPVSNVIRNAGHQEYKIHTGQHYDYEMSQVFFDELGITAPDINLGVGSGTHAKQTGEMLIGIETVLINQNPDVVLVYGDTNSTLAGALATIKLRVKLAHIEAGLRSYNRQMPEEYNRVLTDHCSDLLFCPTFTAVNNLNVEGITSGVYNVGDTMYDAAISFGMVANEKSNILGKLSLSPKKYILATIHRSYNTDNIEILSSILIAFGKVSETIIFPVHPRTKSAIRDNHIPIPQNVVAIDPVGYLDMLMLEQNARIIMTDSGGMQKEAYFFQVPCITLRSETEWVETVDSGCNVLVGIDQDLIVKKIKDLIWPVSAPIHLFGDGRAAEKIVMKINEYMGAL